MKISAGVVARNEVFTLYESVTSILPFVDEVLIVEDCSIDGTNLIAKELCSKNPKIKLHSVGPSARLSDAKNWIDENSSFDYIVWWDADFIAYGDQDFYSTGDLFENINLIPDINQILFGGPNVGPTKSHTVKTKPYQGSTGDTQITKKGLMKFKTDKYIDTRFYTGERKTLYSNKPGINYNFVHLDKVKPLSRIILRDLLYKFETDNPVLESSSKVFNGWLRKNRGDFSLDSAMRFVLKKMEAELIYVNDFIIPCSIREKDFLNWYRLEKSGLKYVAPPEIDEPYKEYFL